MWVVTALHRWTDLKLTEQSNYYGLRVELSMSEGHIGYMPVFETREQALECASGDENIISEVCFVKR
jgi:hypothetical protein